MPFGRGAIRPRATTRRHGGRGAPSRWDFRARVFFALCAVTCASGCACACAALAPGVVRRRADALFRLSIYASTSAFAYRIAYGAATSVKARDFKALGAHLSRSARSNGGQYMIYGSMALASARRGGANAPQLAPLIVLSAYQVLAIGHKVWEDADSKTMWCKLGFGRVFDAAQRNMELALAICATMEVSLMTTILLDLASPQRRSFSRVIAYAFWLRSRYHCHDNTVFRIKFTAHDTAHYHREVWKMLDEKVASKVPALRKALSPFATWFATPSAS